MTVNQEKNYAQNIRKSYQQKESSKLDELIELDAKVKRPANVFAYSFGTIGSLVLGAGMCVAMKVILPSLMPVGIAVGVLGIAMVSANYFIHKAILKKRKVKYADKIIELSDEILNK